MIRQSESIDNLAAALVSAQAAMPSVPKNAKGQVGSAIRSYADLASVLESIQPVLAAHDLAFVQFPHGGSGGSVTVVTRLLHKSGEWMECDASMPTGQGAQAVGSAITYCKRYSLMAVLGLATEDDDGAAASSTPRQQRAPKPRETPPDGRSDMISAAQLTALGASFTGAGIKDRDERLAFVRKAIGRSVETSKDLTKAEASKVFDALEQLPKEAA